MPPELFHLDLGTKNPTLPVTNLPLLLPELKSENGAALLRSRKRSFTAQSSLHATPPMKASKSVQLVVQKTTSRQFPFFALS